MLNGSSAIVPVPIGVSLLSSQAGILAISALRDSLAVELQQTFIRAALQLDSAPALHRASSYLPRWFDGKRGASRVVGIAGVESLTQGSLVAAGAVSLTRRGAWSAGTLYLAAALEVFNGLAYDQGQNIDHILVVGHSYGGAVALVLGELLREARVSRTVSVITYGSPRPGDESFAVAVIGLPSVRWMNSQDPVPRFPPQPAEAPGLYTLLPSVVVAQLTVWQQAGAGLVVYRNGIVSALGLPPLTVPVSELALADWAAGSMGFGDPMHSATSYVTSLFAVGSQKPQSPAEVGQLIGNVSGERPLPLVPADVPLVDAVREVLEGGQRMSVQIPIGMRPTVVKISSKVYRVQWGTHIIATGFSRTNAKAFRKALFKALRVLQTQQNVSITGFENAVATYLAAATNPSGGFVPVLPALP